MNKSELINALSEETTFSKKDVLRFLGAFTRIIVRTLEKGGKVSITGFGCFQTSRRSKRVGVNPATGAHIEIPSMNVPKFKPGKFFKTRVRCFNS